MLAALTNPVASKVATDESEFARKLREKREAIVTGHVEVYRQAVRHAWKIAVRYQTNCSSRSPRRWHSFIFETKISRPT